MSGVLENMEARISRLEQMLAAAQQASQPAQAANVGMQQAANPAQQGGGLSMGGATNTPNVTDAMIIELTQKLVTNEGAKQAAMQALAQLGIQNLPDTRPDQYPAVYQAFKAIEAQYFGGGQVAAGGGLGGLGGLGGGQAQQQTAAPGII